MASCEMRIASSSGKSISSLAEICAGRSRPAPIADAGAGPTGASSRRPVGRAPQCRSPARSGPPGGPPRSGAAPRCPRASTPWTASRPDLHAIARSWRGTRSCRGGSPRRFRSSREIVDAARPRCQAMGRTPRPWARSSAISSRSAKERQRPEGSAADGARCVGGMPPASLNHRDPTTGDTPASRPASSLVRPAAIAAQNRTRSARRATGGRPGERSAPRNARPERRLSIAIATSQIRGVATTG